MRYDYLCSDCGHKWEIEKSIKAPHPKKCPECGKDTAERDLSTSVPAMLYANRPPWTYKECLKYKDCRFNGGPRTKIDPSKHGDLGAWHSPGKVVPFNENDKKKKK